MSHIATNSKRDHCLFTGGEFLADSLARLSCGTASYLVVITEAHSTVACKIQLPAIFAAPFPCVRLGLGLDSAQMDTNSMDVALKVA